MALEQGRPPHFAKPPFSLLFKTGKNTGNKTHKTGVYVYCIQ